MQCGELSEAKLCATGCCKKPHIKQRGSDGVTRQELFTWIRKQYGTEPEYPWHDWNAVLRHNDNNKWYGVVLEVSADKLGLPESGIIAVLNVKSDPLLIGSLYHMQMSGCKLCRRHLHNLQLNGMCLGTFSRRARSLATYFFFARVRIPRSVFL